MPLNRSEIHAEYDWYPSALNDATSHEAWIRGQLREKDGQPYADRAPPGAGLSVRGDVLTTSQAAVRFSSFLAILALARISPQAIILMW